MKRAGRLAACRSLLTAAIGMATWLSGSLAVADSNDAYRRTVTERAQRIVDTIGIEDASQCERVLALIADQYVALNDAHGALDTALKNPDADQQAARDAAHRVVDEHHRRFVAALSADLTPQQVDGVKNGMTYGVVPITYNGYLRLLPDLSDDLKRMILANLLEAREYAMDAGSSDEKHGWFGKYKGRINNRLSAAGIDMKQAERALAEREAAARGDK